MTLIDDDYVPNTAAIVPVQHGNALVTPVAGNDEIESAFRAFEELKAKLLNSDDYQQIGDKSFPKKSAFRKLGVAFGVSTELISKDHERDERGRIIRTEIVVRATAPNGRFADGIGACDRYERCCDGPGVCTLHEFWPDNPTKPTNHVHCLPNCPGHFSHAQHDIPATAMTRATNRAASDLFAGGVVSAEEVSEEPQHQNGSARSTNVSAPGPSDAGRSSNPPTGPRPSKPISAGQIKFVSLLLDKTNRDLLDVSNLIGREEVAIPNLTMDEAKAIIDFLKPIMDGAPDPGRPPTPERRTTLIDPVEVPVPNDPMTILPQSEPFPPDPPEWGRKRRAVLKRTRLRPVSVKQAARNRALRKMKQELIEERGEGCEGPAYIIPSAVFREGNPVLYAVVDACTGIAKELHHVVKRSRQLADRKGDLALLCTSCHRFTEHEVTLATAVGLLRSACYPLSHVGEAS